MFHRHYSIPPNWRMRMNRRETIDIVFIAGVVVVLLAAFIYVNLG